MLMLNAGPGRAADAYLRLLVRYLRMEELHGLRVVELDATLSASLGVEIVPALVRAQHTPLYSPALITQALLEPIRLDGLLGTDAAERDGHLRFLGLFGAGCPPVAELAQHVDRELAGQFFLEKGVHIHASDLAVYVLLAPHMAALPREECLKLPNVYRWARQLQQMPGVAQHLAAVDIPQVERLTLRDGVY